jgi:hypothetical protein
MSKNKSTKSIMEQVMSELRLPPTPAGSVHVDRKEKRKKKFNYKSELKHY